MQYQNGFKTLDTEKVIKTLKEKKKSLVWVRQNHHIKVQIQSKQANILKRG